MRESPVPPWPYWLDRSGHEPTLIESVLELRTGGYMIDFWGAGYTVAERMGILPQVLATGYQVRELCLVNRRGRRVGGFSANVFRRIAEDRFTEPAARKSRGADSAAWRIGS